jgi:hypothetical protein
VCDDGRQADLAPSAAIAQTRLARDGIARRKRIDPNRVGIALLAGLLIGLAIGRRSAKPRFSA